MDCSYLDALQTPSLDENYFDSEVHNPLLSRPSCRSGVVGDNSSMLFLILCVWNYAWFMYWIFYWILFEIYSKTCIAMQELDDHLCACDIIFYIHRLHHFIVALILYLGESTFVMGSPGLFLIVVILIPLQIHFYLRIDYYCLAYFFLILWCDRGEQKIYC